MGMNLESSDSSKLLASLVYSLNDCTYVVHYQAFNLALSQEHILLLLGGGCERKLRVATLTSFIFSLNCNFPLTKHERNKILINSYII
jgi:hypothetical protein